MSKKHEQEQEAEVAALEGEGQDHRADKHKKLEDKLAAMQALVARLIATNQAMAGQMAKFQLQAAERIDARTRPMAQSTAERR